MSFTNELNIASIIDAEVDAVVKLWQRCDLTRPWNDAIGDIARARGQTNSDILVGCLDNVVTATVMVGHDGHRGWVYYVAVDPERHHSGYGRTMMRAAEDWLRQRGIEKIMLMVRPENDRVRAFYRAAGYDEQPRVVFARWLDGRPMTP